MVTKRLTLVALLVGTLSGIALCAQTQPSPQPIAISLCDLLSNPSDFDGKLIQTTGEIHLAFEEFKIVNPQCLDARPSVWLYFGDKTQATIYAPFHSPQFSSGIDFVDDNQMKSFRHLIRQRRDRRPDGTACYDRECNLYDVTATVTGHFLAIKKYMPTTGGGKIPNGYGHMGCCHALIIERVSDLKPQRTRAPDGGTYSCTRSEWKPSSEETKELFPVPTPRCNSFVSCQQIEKNRFQVIAQHWRDQVSIEDGSMQTSFSPEVWYSPDLLLAYQINRADKKNSQLSIERQTCRLHD